MKPDDRDRVMALLLAIWQTPAMSDATRVVWNEFIASLDAEQSVRALRTLQRTSKHRPAQAEFWECYTALNERPIHRAIEQPVDKEAALRARELVAAAAKPGRPITADMLDKAGVPNWRKRILHALELDEVEMRNRFHYDEAWDAIRAEFVAAGERS